MSKKGEVANRGYTPENRMGAVRRADRTGGCQGRGRERIVRRLHAQGITPGHERVRKSLLRQKLRPVYRRPYRVTTDSKHDEPVAANILNRRFEGWRMNRAWVGDITFIATGEGWLY